MLKDVFENRKKPLLNIYFTAGYPKLESLPEILAGLEEGGVDLVEIGIPYSDPLSDGPTIQNSSAIAIKNGISMDLIFDQLAQSQTQVPLIMMGYFNAVYLYGVEKFCKRCQDIGVQGVILPDLPINIYLAEYQAIFEAHQLSMVFLITPETSPERIRYIDECSRSFIYAVSSSSTTGKAASKVGGLGIRAAEDYLARLKAMQLKSPLMVGFNISTKEDFDFAASYTAGGIIGSAFIRQITECDNLHEEAKCFVQSFR